MRRPLLLLLALLVLGGTLRAQEQESGAMNRMLHPDRTLAFSAADRKFDTTAAVGSKQANVRPFAFSRAASTGVYRTRAFGNSDAGYKTEKFTTRTAAAASKGAGDSGKIYAVRAVAVHEDRAAGKSLETRTYVSSGKPFIAHGKRQDTIDELRSTKQMTIEQVRELLNKNR